MKRLFEIRAPGVDSGEVHETIERRVGARKYDQREVDRVAQASFAPVPAAEEMTFHPGATSELFERPVAMPDFRSRKYRWLVWPLRLLVERLYRLTLQVFQKLSQNRIQSFYSVVHELIRMNRRVESMEEQFSRGLLQGAGSVLTIEQAPAVPTELLRLNESAAVELVARQTPGPILCIDDAWAGLAREFAEGGADHILVADAYRRVVDDVRWESAVANADTALISQVDGSLSVIAIPDVGSYTGLVTSLHVHCARKLARGGLLYIRFATGVRNSAFSLDRRFHVDADQLIRAMGGESLTVLRQERPEELQPGSFQIVFEKPRK